MRARRSSRREVEEVEPQEDEEYGMDFLQARRWIYDVAGHQGALVSDKVRPLVGARGRGVFARAPVEEGEALFQIPEDALLRAVGDNGGDDRFGKRRSKGMPRLGSFRIDLAGTLELAVRLLAEANEGDRSGWAEYVALLPIDFDGFPIMWPTTRQRWLLFSEVPDAIRLCEEKLQRKAKAEGIYDVDFLRWALCAVLSRAFDHRTLVPFIDSCNHSFDPTCEVRVTQDGCFNLVAKRNIRSGEEITYDYGSGQPLTNDMLLFGYGFVQQDHPRDCADIPYTLELMKEAHLGAGGRGAGPCEDPDVEMPEAFRIWRGGADDALWFAALLSTCTSEADLESPENARAALKLVAAMLEISADSLRSNAASVRGDKRALEAEKSVARAHISAKLSVLRQTLVACRRGTLRIVRERKGRLQWKTALPDAARPRPRREQTERERPTQPRAESARA